MNLGPEKKPGKAVASADLAQPHPRLATQFYRVYRSVSIRPWLPSRAGWGIISLKFLDNKLNQLEDVGTNLLKGI